MKYIVVLIDGAGDDRLESLGGRTPLMAADMPTVRLLEKRAQIGLVKTVPEGMTPGSDIANLSVMGYDPRIYHTGRSPLEALSIGLDMKEDDVSLRMNLVTLKGEGAFSELVMADYSGGEISSEESAILVEALAEAWAGEKGFEIHHGVSYRHIYLWHKGSLDVSLTPPHNITGEVISSYLPEGANSEFFRAFLRKGYEILRNHPVNLARIAQGKAPANCPWLWGEGKKPRMEDFRKLNGLSGGVISAVDLLRGMARGAGMAVIPVEGATGTIHTNFKGKGEEGLKALKGGLDYLYVHLEAPDECGHQRDADCKVRSLELIDRHILKTLTEGLAGEDFRLLLVPDHRTPIATGKHDAVPVPYLLYDSRKDLGQGLTYDEAAATGGIPVDSGVSLHRLLLEKEVTR